MADSRGLQLDRIIILCILPMKQHVVVLFNIMAFNDGSRIIVKKAFIVNNERLSKSQNAGNELFGFSFSGDLA